MAQKKRNNLIYPFRILIATIITLVAVGCARMGEPDGGPYDETPPQLTSTTPTSLSTTSNRQRIVLEFNENIRLDNASEKVIVSPPQMEMPEIVASGKRITVTLIDSLIPNATYTIDFSDAIVDNNEGNPLGDYAFTFATGDSIDSMQVSGYVLNAANLEPIKGIYVGAYSDLSDSAFRTKPMERVSRTDASGHFSIKGLNTGQYRVYALQDQNQNYRFDQKSEQLAFSDRIIVSSSRPDIQRDTIWHDSLHYDSIVSTPYIHFYPDDIVLLAFMEEGQDRYLIKQERPEPNHFTFFFSAPADELPQLEGTNFDSHDAFVVEHNADKDTVTYWIRDSLIYNLDTLSMRVTYLYTDTLGMLIHRTDTIEITSKLTREKIAKQKKEAYDDWVKESLKAAKNAFKAQRQKEKEEEKAEQGNQQGEGSSGGKKKKKQEEKFDEDSFVAPPMPEEFLSLKLTATNSLAPDRNIDMVFAVPIDTIHEDMFHFFVKKDSVLIPQEFMVERVDSSWMKFRFYAEWELNRQYELQVDTGAFVSIYGMRSAGFKKTIQTKRDDNVSSLYIQITQPGLTPVVQLMDGSDKVVKTVRAVNGHADFFFITPGTYYVRMFDDRNGNGIWDSGNYDEGRQAEDVYYFPYKLDLKALWEHSQTWSPTQRRRFEQKPEAVTKQKPDKKKTSRNKNEEREKEKRRNRK